MLRIAERLARRWHARALVTGEVIGQVASQTLENMTTIADATTLEVLRPLVGMDKDEITAEAQRIGTLSDLDHPGSGLLHAVHAAASGDARAAGGGRARPSRRCRSTRWWTPPWRPRPWRTSDSRC